MKKSFLFLVMLLPVVLFAQKITKSEVDGFTDERLIETSVVTLKQGFSTGFGAQYRLVGRNLYLSIIGYGKKNTIIDEDDRLQFLLSDGVVVKFNSRVELPSNDPDIPNVYIHHYYIDAKDIHALEKSNIVIVRIVSPGSQSDIPVTKKNGQQFSKLSEVFLKEVNKT